ncbi:MAG: cytochrome P450 [Streptosporangiaceae bacterium]
MRRDAVTFLELADPAFSVTSPQVHLAREECWYARTSYGIAVLRREQAAALISHPNLRQGSSAWPAHHGITSGPFADWFANWVLNKEGTDHRRLRKLLNPAFSRRLVEGMRPRFRSLAGELIDNFAELGSCEFMADFAEPFAARVIAHMLGLPEREWPLIARDSATIGLAMGVRIRQDLEQIEAALARLYGYADMVIADRRARPRDDSVTSLVTAHVENEQLSSDELRDTLVLLIFGGFDTTRNQLGLAMQTFIDHPAQWRLLAERPDLAPSAVEEVMRISPTTTWVSRQAIADFTFDGLAIEAGTTIHLLCESAGTDPRSGHATAFDIAAADRSPHLAFGGGVHYCLGHLVARADMSEALAVLARRLREPRVNGAAVWLPCSGNTGPVRLPLAFTPRRA